MKGFASDNWSGVHPDILKAIISANEEHAPAYGDDEYTKEAINKFKEFFGDEIEVFFVTNGTAANVLSLYAATNSFNSIICPETAHINVDECGAPEKQTGCKLLSVETKDGKLDVEKIKKHMHGIGFEHHAQPKIVTMAQATEIGTIYSQTEIKKITNYAHENNLIVHMDGARLANAAVALNASFKELTVDAGIDILSFGGTKNGVMYGEAVVFFDKTLSRNFKYIRKQGMQLISKMRFISAQFKALLSNDLWKKNATHANEMAQLLAKEIETIPKITITQPVESNGVFAIIPSKYIQKLQKEFFFHIWNEEKSEVRWMTSYDTTEEEINSFSELLKQVIR